MKLSGQFIILHRCLMLLIWMTIISHAGYLVGQKNITYTSSFQRNLDVCGLELLQPTEGRLFPNGKLKDDLAKYDIILESEDRSMEMRVIITLPEQNKLEVPHIPFMNLISTFATNDTSALIHLRPIDATRLAENLYADSGYTADFIPKSQLTSNTKAHMSQIAKNGGCTASALILYQDELSEYYRNPLRFLSPSTESLEEEKE